MAAEECLDLPDECWELIMSGLPHHRHLEAMSLVSKRFLGITSRLRRTLTVADPTFLTLPRLFLRFTNLRGIQIRDFHGEPDELLRRIARSGLDLHSLDLSTLASIPSPGFRELGSRMANLRFLRCSRIGSLEDRDLVVIADSCPFLQDLDISYPENAYSCCPSRFIDSPYSLGFVSDAGIAVLSAKLKSLRTIDISGNHFVTDQSLVALSLNCAFLKQVAARDCNLVTQCGISFAVRNCPRLSSMWVNGIGFPSVDSRFRDCFAYAGGLSDIELSNSFVSDELLLSLAQAELPLKKLSLPRCLGFTVDGISRLLCKYPSLRYLDLEAANFLTDGDIAALSKYFHGLDFVNLSLCPRLTNATFFTVVGNCRRLNEIKMERTNLGKGACAGAAGLAANTQVKALDLACNRNLGTECIRKFLSACPSLELLDVSNCSAITDRGILHILRSCPELKHLEMNQCAGLKDIDADFGYSKLEVLRAQELRINDSALSVIGRRCRSLLQLDLEGCLNVSDAGVRELVQNCRALREINLRRCNSVSVDSVAWMVFSRPSLRKIIPPCGFVPTHSQRDLFLRHGCLVCNG